MDNINMDNELNDLERDAMELQDALNELIRVYQFRDRKRICCHDVSVTQCYAMREMARSGPMTLSELAKRLYLDDSTASRVVDSLERKGYTNRRRDPKDARALRVELSPAGRELYDQIEADLIEEQKTLLAAIDPEIRQATTRLIARLAREAAARLSRRDGRCCGPIAREA
jgi:MarR family 2-MHQ and catechol resistance regulon transcriptional repressor